MRQRGRCACAARSPRPSSRMRAAMQKPQKLAMCGTWSSGLFLEGSACEGHRPLSVLQFEHPIINCVHAICLAGQCIVQE